MDETNPIAVDASKALLFNRDSFSCDIIDGELVLLNRHDGVYYCVSGSIAEVWPMLTSGVSLAAAIDEAKRIFAGERHLADAEIRRLAEVLTKEGIVTQVPPAEAARLQPGVGPATFVPFTFEKFSDLQDLLTLDPLHDVESDTGWPSPRKSQRWRRD